jgi:hypothetical protein
MNYTTFGMFQRGLPGDIPVSSDYDGTARPTLPTCKRHLVYLSVVNTNFTASATYQWGLPGDVPVPGDYDGDGLTDLAVYRPPTGM